MPTPIAFTRPDERQVELLLWTDRDLDDMAIVSSDDQRRAASYWRRLLPPQFRDVLDAVSTIGQ